MDFGNNAINSPILETHVGINGSKKEHRRFSGGEYNKLHEHLAKVFVRVNDQWFWADGHDDDRVAADLQGILPGLNHKHVYRYRTVNFGKAARAVSSERSEASSAEISAIQERLECLETVVAKLWRVNQDLTSHLIDSGNQHIDVGKASQELGLAIRATLDKLPGV